VLSDGDNGGLMVRARVDRAETVSARGDSRSDISGDSAINRSSVDTLEEGKGLRVCGSGLREVRKRLYHDVSVANDLPSGVKLLGRSKVTLLRIYKVTGIKVVDVHRDGELCVSCNGVPIGRTGELGRRHVRDRRDGSNRGRVT